MKYTEEIPKEEGYYWLKYTYLDYFDRVEEQIVKIETGFIRTTPYLAICFFDREECSLKGHLDYLQSECSDVKWCKIEKPED